MVTQALSPQQLASQRQLAELLLRQATTGGPTTPVGAIARSLQGLVAGRNLQGVQERENAARQALVESLGQTNVDPRFQSLAALLAQQGGQPGQVVNLLGQGVQSQVASEEATARANRGLADRLVVEQFRVDNRQPTATGTEFERNAAAIDALLAKPNLEPNEQRRLTRLQERQSRLNAKNIDPALVGQTPSEKEREEAGESARDRTPDFARTLGVIQRATVKNTGFRGSVSRGLGVAQQFAPGATRSVTDALGLASPEEAAGFRTDAIKQVADALEVMTNERSRFSDKEREITEDALSVVRSSTSSPQVREQLVRVATIQLVAQDRDLAKVGKPFNLRDSAVVKELIDIFVDNGATLDQAEFAIRELMRSQKVRGILGP